MLPPMTGYILAYLELVTKKWEAHFLSKGSEYTLGFLAGMREAHSPLRRWVRKILCTMDAREIGAKRALRKMRPLDE